MSIIEEKKSNENEISGNSYNIDLNNLNKFKNDLLEYEQQKKFTIFLQISMKKFHQ